MTRKEYDELFLQDAQHRYVNLVIPANDMYPEMNLIGKLPEDYTLEEVVRSKGYARSMRKQIVE